MKPVRSYKKMKYESLQSGCYYHIFNQGNNKEDIFIEEENYDYFLKRIIKYICPVANIWSYCLLKNHFHLLIQTKVDISEKKISLAFSNLFNSYSKSINKKYNRTGSLFRDRFRRKVINSEEYLRSLIVYINLNPVTHGFTNDIKTYKHSSYLAIISDKPTLLFRKDVIELFDIKENFIYYIENKIITSNEEFTSLTFE